VKFFYIIFRSLLCYLNETGLLLKLAPETISSKKKVCSVLLPPFYIERRIRFEKISGSGIKHPGSIQPLVKKKYGCTQFLRVEQFCGSGSEIRDPVFFYPPDPG
jgi:hypothetical protein